MLRKRLSRGRGPRITEEELDKILGLYLEGKTFKVIAQETGRHWQTVRKYAIKELQEREGKELRHEALKGALIDHFKDLVSALGSLERLLEMPVPGKPELPSGWRPPLPERRERLLFQALKESHAKESPLWSHWDSWNYIREAYEEQFSGLQQRLKEYLASLEQSHPGTSFTGSAIKMLLHRGGSLAMGLSAYDPSMLNVIHAKVSKTINPGEELWLGQSTNLANGPDMKPLREEVSTTMVDMAEWEEVQEMARLRSELTDIKEKIAEEAMVLSLKRAFPGRCRLCPL